MFDCIRFTGVFFAGFFALGVPAFADPGNADTPPSGLLLAVCLLVLVCIVLIVSMSALKRKPGDSAFSLPLALIVTVDWLAFGLLQGVSLLVMTPLNIFGGETRFLAYLPWYCLPGAIIFLLALARAAYQGTPYRMVFVWWILGIGLIAIALVCLGTVGASPYALFFPFSWILVVPLASLPFYLWRPSEADGYFRVSRGRIVGALLLYVATVFSVLAFLGP